jgi:hypothetical protein
MAEATLGDLIKEVRKTNKSQEETTGAIQALTSVFAKQFTAQKYGAGDRLEDKIEGKKTGGAAAAANVPNIDIPGGNMFGGIFATIRQLAALATGFAASVAAVVGAFAGLRGWELTAIKNLGVIGDNLKALIPESIGKNITQAIINLRARILRRFGINPALPTEFDEATNKRLQIRSPGALIADTFSKLSQNILAKFGIGADGKLIALQDAEGKFKSPRFGKLIIQVKSFFRPFFSLTEGIGNFFKSDFFTKITGFIGGGAKAVARVFQKILWPIGFLFSAWDGVQSYINSDADGFIGKLGDGIGGFLGDFIGAPFDLLKKGVAWIIKKLFGVEVNADGTVPEGQGLPGWIVQQLNSFSFEETIKSIVSGLFGVVQGAVDWVKLLFTDPTAAIEQLWTTYIGVWNGFGDFIYTKLVKPAVEWVTGLFGWDETELPTWEGLKSIASEAFYSVRDWVKDKFTGGFEELKDLATGLGDIIKAVGDNLGLIKDILVAEVQYQITRISNGFKNSFDRIATFINTLGDRLYIILSENLQFTMPRIAIPLPWPIDKELVVTEGFTVGVGDAQSRAARQTKIDQAYSAMEGRIGDRNSETANAYANVENLYRDLVSNLASQPVVINQVDNSNNSTNTSTSSNVSNSGGSTDRSAPLYDPVF